MGYTTPTHLTAGQVFTASKYNTEVADNIAALASTSYCWMYRTTDQSIPNNTFTLVAWQATQILRGMSHSAGVVTLSEPGIYQVKVLISWASSTVGLRSARILQNSNVIHELQLNPSNGAQNLNGAMDLNCAAGDTIQVLVLQTSGGALAVRSGSIGASTMQVSLVAR